MKSNKTDGNRTTIVGMLLQHFIVFLICIVFPGLVTWMAPATWLTYDRSEDGVQCKATTCVYFVVPYKVQRVDHVTDIGSRERESKTEKQRKLGRTTGKTIHVDGEGFLLIHGAADQLAEVNVSPASLESKVERSKSFLNSGSEKSLTMFVIANWKFGGLMGGVLSSFTALCVVGYTLGFLKWILEMDSRYHEENCHAKPGGQNVITPARLMTRIVLNGKTVSFLPRSFSGRVLEPGADPHSCSSFSPVR
jgi:hypothetical protein